TLSPCGRSVANTPRAPKTSCDGAGTCSSNMQIQPEVRESASNWTTWRCWTTSPRLPPLPPSHHLSVAITTAAVSSWTLTGCLSSRIQLQSFRTTSSVCSPTGPLTDMTTSK
ncbi:hypothetical protein MAR_011072, partial [Mya arenaria]